MKKEIDIRERMMEEEEKNRHRRIETIARGVCVQDGRILLCRPKGGVRTYLPGGHVEFGETAAHALMREMREEMGVRDVAVCNFLGIVENGFFQGDGPHMEVNIVYQMRLPPNTPAVSKEDWIEFEWCPLTKVDDSNILPEAMKSFMRTSDLDSFTPIARVDGDLCTF